MTALRCIAWLCVFWFGCGADPASLDAAVDAETDTLADTGDDAVRDAGDDAGDDGGPFEGMRPIRSEDFDCRAEPPERRPGVAPECWLDPSCESPLVVGHRGTGGNFALYAPENSLSAIRLAILLGVDAVEIDLRDTADGEIVLMHDSTLARTTASDASVRDLTLVELQAIALNADGHEGDFGCETVPDFRAALRLARDRVRLILDTKTDRSDLVAQILVEEEMLDQAYISVSSVSTAVLARETVPEARVQIRPDTVEEYEAMSALFTRPVDIIEVPLSEAANFLPIAEAISAKVYVNVFDLDALVLTLGDLSRYGAAYESGAHIAQTEFPFWMLEWLARRDWSTLPAHKPQTLDSPLLR